MEDVLLVPKQREIVITYTPKTKLLEMKNNYIDRKSFGNKIYLKNEKIISLKSSYGSYCPMGKMFCRNVVNNMVQNLLNMLLLFDISEISH